MVATTPVGVVPERHVGVIDTANDSFIDVTEATRSTGFSVASPYDKWPYITDGSLRFIRNSEEEWSYDIATGEGAMVGPVVPGQERDLPIDTADRRISPNGRLAAEASCPLGFRGCPEGGNLHIFPVNVTDGSQVKAIVVNGNMAPVRLLGWVDNKRVLIQSGYARSDSNIEVLNIAGAPSGKATTLHSRYLLPPSNRTNFAPIASPNGKEVVFISRDDKGASAVYVTTTDGKGEPQELRIATEAWPANVSSFGLVEWR